MYNNIYNDSYNNCGKNSLVNVIFVKITSASFFMYDISNLISHKKNTRLHVDKTGRKIVSNDHSLMLKFIDCNFTIC